MGKITIKQITMDNFKGEIHRTTKFKDNVTVLSGRNGSGKSRHMDAFLWCLFGKDSMERKDYEVKTYVCDNLKSNENVSVDCLPKGVEFIKTLINLFSGKMFLKLAYS